MSCKQIIFAGIFGFVSLFGSVFYVKMAWCEIKAKDIGISSKYTLVSGCLFSDAEEFWVAPDKFRSIMQ